MSRKTLVITYDIHAGADYSELYSFLEASGAFSVSDSTWLLCTEEDAEVWYGRIEAVYYDMTLVVMPLGEGVIGGTDDEMEGYLAGCDVGGAADE
jgi:hypothetical protein